MCGRYSQTHSIKLLEEAFRAIARAELTPAYNIPPGQDIAAVRNGEDGREIVALHWGLVPSWMKEYPKSTSMINARAETVAEKPSFRAAYKRRRCLIPADGFYEWKKEGDKKQPYYIHLPDNKLFAFAGLWEHWSKDDRTVESCTIITTEANEEMSAIHERMPVIVPEDGYRLWLDGEGGPVSTLLEMGKHQKFEMYPVSTYVNAPKNNDEKCIERLVG